MKKRRTVENTPKHPNFIVRRDKRIIEMFSKQNTLKQSFKYYVTAKNMTVVRVLFLGICYSYNGIENKKKI